MQSTNTLRFEGFSDGVFAIAVTLLALQLRVPYLEGTGFSFAGLLPLIPDILTFVLSFLAIAIFWVNHHQLTQNINSITRRRILWLNVLFLLFLTLVPFVTQTMSLNNTSALAVSIYACIMWGASTSFSLLRYYIHQSLGESSIPMRRSIVGPIVYILAILAPIISIPVAYSLLLIPPLFYFLPKGSNQPL